MVSDVYCGVCGRINNCICGKYLYVPIEEQEHKDVLSLRELRNKHFGKLYHYGSFSFPEQCTILIYGLPGSGKSTFALRLCDVIRDVDILYLSLEEGEENIARRIRLNEITNDKIRFAFSKSVLETVDVDVIVVDSINYINNIEEIDVPLKILISQSTKQGNYKGKSKVGHDADVIIRCESFKAVIEKNRFGDCFEVNFL